MHVLVVKIKPQKDRLDQYISTQLKNISRSKANKLAKAGNVLVNQISQSPDYKVRKGDKIKVEIPLEEGVSLKAENIPLKIVFEDKDLLVVDKDPGIVVHPTIDHPTGTLVNAVLSHLGKFEEEDFRPGIVHRLDKDTSGLIVVAKTQESLELLKYQFKKRHVEKTYIALVSGVVAKERGSIIGRIERHPKFKQKFTVSESGKEAQTEYKVVQRFEKFTLLELHPFTGRTHQLRVHLNHIGHPIVGDKLYGGKMALGRQFLHAAEIKFVHPVTKKELHFHSKLPDDLQKLLNKLNKDSE